MNNKVKDTIMKTNIISKAIANNKTKKAVLKRAYDEVGHFRTPKVQKVVENISSFVGPMAAADAYCFASTLSQPIEFVQGAAIGFFGLSAYIFRHVAVKAHKEMVDDASRLGSQLIEKGFNKAERKIVIKDKLSSGNLIFSNLFKLIYPKRVEKLADGIPTKSGFIKM